MQNKEKNSFIRLYIEYIVLRPQIAIFPVKISILSFGKIGVKSQYIVRDDYAGWEYEVRVWRGNQQREADRAAHVPSEHGANPAGGGGPEGHFAHSGKEEGGVLHVWKADRLLGRAGGKQGEAGQLQDAGGEG